MRRTLIRLTVLAGLALVVAGGAGLLLGDDDRDRDRRRAGLPPTGYTVATLLDDGTPVFVTHTPTDVAVIDARTPPRPAPGRGVALADLVDGLVAWCDGRGFVDALAPSATFTLQGRSTGPTKSGLGVYPITERHRGYVLVGQPTPAGAVTGSTRSTPTAAGAGPTPAGAAPPGRAQPTRTSGMVAECADPEGTDHHGVALRKTAVSDVPPEQYWVVEAAVDLRAGVLCAPPEDPLAWPLCPDGGVAAELPQRQPTDRLVKAHGPAYAERAAYGFVGRFAVHRDDPGEPLANVWRTPYSVELRAEPRARQVEARLSLAEQPAPTVTGQAPLASVALRGAGDDAPGRLAVEPTTEVVLDGRARTGQAAVTALTEAIEADPNRRWTLSLRHDPLRPPRLRRVEPAAG